MAFPSPRMILDTAGCGRRQGSPVAAATSDRSRGKALTAILAYKIIQLSGAKEKKENSARDNNHQERRLHKIPHTTQRAVAFHAPRSLAVAGGLSTDPEPEADYI